MAPAEGDVRSDHVHVHSPRCPYCHAPVERGEGLRVCASCHAFHHESCWQEHGDCAACSPRPGQTTLRSETSVAPGRKRAIWPAALGAMALVALTAEGIARMARRSGSPDRAPSTWGPLPERSESDSPMGATSSEGRSPGSQAPTADVLVSRELSDGYSILASETERVESESFTAADLEAAIARAQVREGQALSELRLTGALLPWRALYRVRRNDDRGRLLLVAVGFAEGLGVVVRVSTPAVSLDGAAELLRLTSMIESVKPLPSATLWPRVALGLEALPRGASGSIQRPRGWRRSVKLDDDQWVTWSGYGGDSIELIVTSRDQTVLGGEKVLILPIGAGRRVLVICAYAATPARLERVAAVARACAATLELAE